MLPDTESQDGGIEEGADGEETSCIMGKITDGVHYITGGIFWRSGLASTALVFCMGTQLFTQHHIAVLLHEKKIDITTPKIHCFTPRGRPLVCFANFHDPTGPSTHASLSVDI